MNVNSIQNQNSFIILLSIGKKLQLLEFEDLVLLATTIDTLILLVSPLLIRNLHILLVKSLLVLLWTLHPYLL